MDLCSWGHEEICFESGFCPLCEAKERCEELEANIEALDAEVDKLEGELEDAFAKQEEVEAYIIKGGRL